MKITIGSREGSIQIISYSVVEDSTPIDPSDSSGGIQQASWTMATPTDWKTFKDKPATITDSSQGTTQLIITDVSESNGILAVTANSRLARAAVTRTAQPYVGTLGGYIRLLLGQVGITTDIVIDASLESVPVTFAGWQGEIYFYLTKMLGAAYEFEVAAVGAQTVFRPFRLREAVTYRDSGRTHAISQGNVAQTVVTNYYTSTYQVNVLAYPPGGWTPDVTVYQADAGQTITVDTLATQASLSAIQQPTYVANVLRTDGTASVYTVAGSDGLPITPTQWQAMGGKLSVSINEDTSSLTLTFTAMNFAAYSPYRIAVSSGASNYYSSLRIIGTGVFVQQKSVTGYSTLSKDVATQEVGVTVDSPFITTIGQAYDLNIWTLAHYSGLSQTLSSTSSGINRTSDSGSYSYPTIAEFNAANAGQTIAQFDTAWAGRTILDFNTFWNGNAASKFANQAFGNIGGARTRRDDNYFRIRTATNSAGQVSYSAEADTTVGDFDLQWPNKTIADFNNFWYKKTLADFDVSPLSAPTS